MCALIKQYGPLLGRILLSAIFIIGAILKARTFESASGYLASQGVGLSDAVLVLMISIEMIGGTLILIGLKARHAAMMIFIYLIPLTLFFHSYWTYDGPELMKHFHHFFKNLAMMGGMVFIMVNGSGPLSIENKFKKS
jgi:putative oxidoreductase